ncbi:peptidoglycan-binding domain-containing protein [Wukongibacter baidiensis]|uniref:peptidoglycan-binding domain-containing protein n=1 Tax=Wukongibacter baidiensis TaxID=1723361 RepID=UPI003D7FF3A8
MNKKQLITGIISISLLSQPILTTNVYAASEINNTITLKTGMRGQSIKDLQLKLKQLGYFNNKITGYFGNITKGAVLRFQKDSSLIADGIVGKSTLNALIIKTKPTQVSRGSARPATSNEWSWFGKIKDIIPRGTTYKITDIKTGKSFNVKRTYGTNHADSETLTKEDTSIMKEVYGGKWSWIRRPIIVEVGDYKLPASMAGMPHGSDFIRDNNMGGHFDVHFLKSKTHGTNRINPDHQKAVKEARKFLSE